MAYADRVLETTTTTGTGALTLGGAIAGFRTFASVFRPETQVYYTISDNLGNWEVGSGTFNAVLRRERIIASSNACLLVNLPAGTKSVFVTQPATAVADMGMTTAFRRCMGGF